MKYGRKFKRIGILTVILAVVYWIFVLMTQDVVSLPDKRIREIIYGFVIVESSFFFGMCDEVCYYMSAGSAMNEDIRILKVVESVIFSIFFSALFGFRITFLGGWLSTFIIFTMAFNLFFYLGLRLQIHFDNLDAEQDNHASSEHVKVKPRVRKVAPVVKEQKSTIPPVEVPDVKVPSTHSDTVNNIELFDSFDDLSDPNVEPFETVPCPDIEGFLELVPRAKK